MADAGDLDSARFEVDDEKHEVANQPTGGQHFYREEIRRSYRSPMRF